MNEWMNEVAKENQLKVLNADTGVGVNWPRLGKDWQPQASTPLCSRPSGAPGPEPLIHGSRILSWGLTQDSPFQETKLSLGYCSRLRRQQERKKLQEFPNLFPLSLWHGVCTNTFRVIKTPKLILNLKKSDTIGLSPHLHVQKGSLWEHRKMLTWVGRFNDADLGGMLLRGFQLLTLSAFLILRGSYSCHPLSADPRPHEW